MESFMAATDQGKDRLQSSETWWRNPSNWARKKQINKKVQVRLPRYIRYNKKTNVDIKER